MSFPGRLLLPACLLSALALVPFQEARAQSEPAFDPQGPRTDAPYQFIPLNTPSDAVAPDTDPNNPSRDAVKKKDDAVPPSETPTSSSLSFAPLTAATRPATADTGFAPVVGTSTASLAPASLVNSSGGLPRLYAPGFRLGPFDVRPDATVSGTYNDNIYLAPQGRPRTGDFITTISPSVSASYNNGDPDGIDGTEFDFSYAPSGLVFSQYGGNSALNQQVNASLSHQFSKLRVAVGQSYSHVSGGLIQAGDLVTQDYYSTSLDADYALTAKTSGELAGGYSNDSYSTGFGSEDYNASAFLNYELRPKLTVSIAPSIDYLVPENGAKQTALGGLFRIAYSYSAKTSVYFEIGGDQREYSNSNLTSLELNYIGGLQWSAGPKTSVALTVSRATHGSSIGANQDYISSDVGVSISQNLLGPLSGSISGGYEHSDYYSTQTGAATFRYDYFSISPSLQVHPAIWNDIGVSYLFRQSMSNTGASEFTDNQFSVYSSVRF